MSHKLSIGIVGLPNVGKSTLFKALTKKQVNIANYPFTTIDPNVGVVAAKDERLEKIAKIFISREVLPAPLEFVDIAGLVKGAHKGAGLGNQFLAHIREVDAIAHIVRIFKSEEVIHVEAKPDPVQDFETVLEELRLKDEQSKEKINLLSKKPQLICLNGRPEEIDENLISKIKSLGFSYIILDLSKDLSDEDLKKIFEAFYKLLDLIVFYTANENEARSWLIKKGMSAKQGVGKIHRDFEEKFIKAEVINWQQLLSCCPEFVEGQQNCWAKAKQKGLIRLEGKDYIVQGGDVVVVKHG